MRRGRRRARRVPRATAPDPRCVRRLRDDKRLPQVVRDDELVRAALASSASREPKPVSTRTRRPLRSSGIVSNVLLVSHSDFSGPSAFHVSAIARELQRRGLSPVIAIPDDLSTLAEVGDAPFAIIGFRDVVAGRSVFAEGWTPDLVHAFSPRERVRRLTASVVARFACPYVIHLEDNDAVVLASDFPGSTVGELDRLPLALLDRLIGSRQFHPVRGRRFIDRAAGATVVTNRLLELVPRDVPAAVVKPGFDHGTPEGPATRARVRRELALGEDDFVVAYTGTVHAANVRDVGRLYEAVQMLRDDGAAVVLLKTGWDGPEASTLPRLGDGIRGLGRIARTSLPGVLAAADALVQPGGPGPFDDYRFPAKLPDFLASGKPTILPRSNIGLELTDRCEAMLLRTGSAREIAGAIAFLRQDRHAAERIGAAGRAFALRELRWSKSADVVVAIYGEAAVARQPPMPPWTLDPPPGVKIICVVSGPPNVRDAARARGHGIYGFCFPTGSGPPARDVYGGTSYPYCYLLEPADDAVDEVSLHDHAYITLHGSPLVVTAGDTRPHILAADVNVAPLAVTLSPSPRAMVAQLSTASQDSMSCCTVPIGHNRRELSTYRTWLRKLVLRALAGGASGDHLIFVEAGDRFPSRAGLRATRAAIRDAFSQFYASQGLDVAGRAIEKSLRPQAEIRQPS